MEAADAAGQDGMAPARGIQNRDVHRLIGETIARLLVRQTKRLLGILKGRQAMRWQDHITVNPLVVHGQACIRGTRIPVAVVLANLADGLPPDDIIRSYPSLTREGIQAALAYAADLAQERVLPLPA